MQREGRERVVIEGVWPQVDGGRFAVKRVLGETTVVRAAIFADGHDQIDADLLFKMEEESAWQRVGMRPIENDNWEAAFEGKKSGNYLYTIEAWVDHFTTWQHDLKRRQEAGQDLTIDLLIGVDFLQELLPHADGDDQQRLLSAMATLKKQGAVEERFACALLPELSQLARRYSKTLIKSRYEKVLKVHYTRKRALFSSWYECFPRSCGPDGLHGTFADCAKELPRIAAMGFDVLYLPPIHPIGRVKRKGKNNSLAAGPDDPGSPWAIGAKEGGHDAIHPELGTLADFRAFIGEVAGFGMEVAMDLAFQCSPDHPYEKAHPTWFRWRPDGAVQFAENPPKKYEDIIPFYFETDDWRSLWEELKRIVLFWVEQGIRIFRVDNPHTKPFGFWEWLIEEVKKVDPDILFLSEAFTRPKVMQRLAKLGFDQSYTYFTWRNSKQELIEYIEELASEPLCHFFRPNFWPNTPDILPEVLQYGGPSAFMARLVLAATLSSNYGIYGPPFERCERKAVCGEESYADSEKYALRSWGKDGALLESFIGRINQIRRDFVALQTPWNIRFLAIENDQLICYAKLPDLVIVVSLDFFHSQSGEVELPLEELGVGLDSPFLVHELLRGERAVWQGSRHKVRISPESPASIFQISAHVQREDAFETY